MATVVQSLWIGPELSRMEQLSVRSFLAQGHPYHLYSYEDVAGVPAGALVRDAGEILPASMVFQYRDHPSYAGFANFFRYRLLLERGGWWADADVVCLRALEFGDDHVFASEVLPGGGSTATNWLIKAPAGSGVMEYAWDRCRRADVGRLRWGEVGARLLHEAVVRHGATRLIRGPDAFGPIPYTSWDLVTRPRDEGGVADLPPESYTVHLWNEMWRRAGRDKEARYAPGCLYERLIARFSPAPGIAARRPPESHRDRSRPV